MSKWGLLAGIGAGLSQSSQIIGQGLAEDRAVKRAEELERMREASIEKRWKMQTDREDAIRKEQNQIRAAERAEDVTLRREQIDYARGRDGVMDSRYASDKISRQIEGEMERSYKEMREEMRTVAGQYDSTISALRKERETLIRVKDSADPMGLGEQTNARSPAEIKNRLEYIDTQLEKLQGERKSTMAEMRSESLKRLQGIAGAYDPSIIESSSFKGYMQAAGQELATFTKPDIPTPEGKDAPGNDVTSIAGALGGNSAMAQAANSSLQDDPLAGLRTKPSRPGIAHLESEPVNPSDYDSSSPLGLLGYALDTSIPKIKQAASGFASGMDRLFNERPSERALRGTQQEYQPGRQLSPYRPPNQR